MRHVVIVRHAKSDWADWSLADHDRPLAPRGIEALDRMRDHLAGGTPPDLVLCSSARRTQHTLAGLRAALPQDVDVRIEGDLYGASASSLVERLRRVDDAITTVMLVGHNPGVHQLAVGLVGDSGADGGGGDDPETWERLMTKYPTGAIATVSFQGAWAGIEPGCADLDGFFTPRPPR